MASSSRGNRWKRTSHAVNLVAAFKTGKHNSQIEALENKFCSTETKQRLARNNSQLKRAAFYTKPSQQVDCSGLLMDTSSRQIVLPPLTSSAARLASSEENSRAIQRRLKRKRSVLPGHSLSHQGSNMTLAATPRFLTDEVWRLQQVVVVFLHNIVMSYTCIRAYNRSNIII